jgi:hypothetical protein
MNIVSAGIASLAVALAMPADAQLLAHKDLSLITALSRTSGRAQTSFGASTTGYGLSYSKTLRRRPARNSLRPCTVSKRRQRGDNLSVPSARLSPALP